MNSRILRGISRDLEAKVAELQYNIERFIKNDFASAELEQEILSNANEVKFLSRALVRLFQKESLLKK